ncbi:MAG: HNH endonuclease [Lactobacillaceae bacterium]|jgi:hypothetical protein|nr:HNH endonuclease [Lactobacillaceae bacterium]
MRNKFKSPYRATKTYVNGNGYRVFKDSGISVHRHIAEQKLGRPLKDGEVVHHKDRNKLNNSPSNLYVFPNQQAHWNAHKQDYAKYGMKYSLTGKNKYQQ